MSPEGWWLDKLILANVAFKRRSKLKVSSPVISKGRSLCKSLRAQIALIGFFPGVRTEVDYQSLFACKTFAASFTFPWAFWIPNLFFNDIWRVHHLVIRWFDWLAGGWWVLDHSITIFRVDRDAGARPIPPTSKNPAWRSRGFWNLPRIFTCFTACWFLTISLLLNERCKVLIT